MLNLKSKIPIYLPLAEAACKYGLPEQVLTQLIQAGKIEAVQLPTGELRVAAENNGYELKTKTEIITKEFTHLQGQRITVTEAADRYNLHRDAGFRMTCTNLILASIVFCKRPNS